MPKAIRYRLDRIAIFILLAGVAGLFFTSLVWPVASIVLRSFNERGQAVFSQGLFFGNYTAIYTDPFLRFVVGKTIWLSGLSTILTAALAFPTAFLISKMRRNTASLVMVLVAIPLWVSILVRLFAFTTILGKEGVINSLLGMFGLGPYPLLFNSFAALIGMVAYLLPYLILILVSAMASVDQSLVTAAKTMGATGAQSFRQVYFPQIRAAFVSGLTLVFVMGLGFFLTPAILGGPSDVTIPVYIQQQVNLFAWGKASATGITLLVISIVGYAIAFRIGGVEVLAPGRRSGSKGVSSQEPMGSTPLVIFCSIMLIMTLLLLLLPLAIVVPAAFSDSSAIRFPPVGFTLKWFEQALTDPFWTSAIMKSLRVGLATAIASTAIGLLLARVGSRIGDSRLRSLLQYAVISAVVVPTILLAIGVFDVQNRLGLLGTEFGLAAVHTVISVPLSFLIIANALSKCDPQIEEAAWTMGSSRTKAFWTVVVPNIGPALIGSFLAALATSWDEAVVALFQTGIEKTLPVSIFSFLKSGVTPVVAAIAVILIIPIVAAIAIVYLVRARRLSAAAGPDRAQTA